MAETIIAELVKTIVDKLGSKVLDGIMLTGNLDSQMRSLWDVKSAIQAALLDADSTKVCSHSQRLVLEKLDLGLTELVDIQDKLATRAQRKALVDRGRFLQKVHGILSAPSRAISYNRYARRINKVTEELNLIAENHAHYGSIIGSSSVNQIKNLSCLETGSYLCTDLVVGRDKDRDNIINTLLDSSTFAEFVTVTSIVGIGGIGKTTLAQYVYHDQRTKLCFDVQLWVSSVEEFELKELLKKMLASATHENLVDCEIDLLQHHMFQAIAGKKFLLVLDSIWDQDNLRAKWLQLRSLLRVGNRGSKVLVTTRSESVSRIMDSCHSYKISELEEDDSWILFKHIALTQGHESGVEAIGKEISQSCLKIPLVIRVIASLMAEKFTVQEWQSFMDHELKHFASYECSIMDILKLSYDHLNWRLKLCVTYCSLFRRGGKIHIDKIIRLWVAMGYVEQHHSDQSMEDTAKEYLSRLILRGFFSNIRDTGLGAPYLEMPSLMHELVVWIGGFKYKIVDSNTVEFDERVQHISDPESLLGDPTLLLKTRYLKSLLINGQNHNMYMKNIVSLQYLRDSLQHLRALRLSGLNIKELPSSIGKLELLRYLDLSSNPILMLPKSITNLVNLYLLNLSKCSKLQELPTDISKLVNLRHLLLFRRKYLIPELPEMELGYMPKKLSQLTQLQTLDYFVLGRKNDSLFGKLKPADFCGLADLNCFDNVGPELTITVASSSKHLVRKSKPASIVRKEKITSLEVRFRDGAKEDEILLDCLQPNANLTEFIMKEYGGQRLPFWMRDQLHWLLPNLQQVCISGCKNCTYLCSFGRLPHLRYLYLMEMDNVEYMENTSRSGNNEDDINVGDQCSPPLFPSLKFLFLREMPKLKGWWRVDKTRQVLRDENQHHLQEWLPSFPKLYDMEMKMEMVIALAREFSQPMPSLQKLTVVYENYVMEMLQLPMILLNQYLPNLEDLNFEGGGIKVVPEEFRGMSSLKTLKLSHCDSLEALPEWIDTFTSLENLEIHRCPEIKSFPRGISNLSNLKKLYMIGCSKVLERRCQDPTGEDWLKIQHISNITILDYTPRF